MIGFLMPFLFISQKDNRVRQRKIIWFNPPFSVNVEINIGKTFLKLIDENFQKPTSSTNYSTETMSKLATVVYLILPT